MGDGPSSDETPRGLRPDERPDAGPDERPEWWDGNEEIRETLGIDGVGPYEPPRFADGAYTHEIVPALEDRYDCSIRILSLNPDRDGRWEIRVDGRTVGSTERRRNENGNSIYVIDSGTFVEVVEGALAE